jgi:valyl-tRNA synthetase
MALDEIGLFNKVDVMLLNQTEYVNVLLWFLIINLLWKKYYVSSFEYPIKKTIIVKPVLDKKLRYISKDNNNLISINDLLEKYGSTILRLSYAIGGIDDENNIFDIN